MYIADMLSRAYLQADHSQHRNIPEYQIFQLSQEQLFFQEIADINQADYMRLSGGTHQQIKQCTIADAALQSLMNMIMTVWPLTKEEVPDSVHEYWNYKEELTVQDGVLYKGMKVIVPASMRPQMIARAHSSHLQGLMLEYVERAMCYFGQAWQTKSKIKFRTVKFAMTS